MVAMKRAWEIRKEAASRLECKVMDIHFGTCLKMAWAEIKGEVRMEAKIQRAMDAAKKIIQASVCADEAGEYWHKTLYSYSNGTIIINMTYGHRKEWKKSISIYCNIKNGEISDKTQDVNCFIAKLIGKEAAEAALEIIRG